MNPNKLPVRSIPEAAAELPDSKRLTRTAGAQLKELANQAEKYLRKEITESEFSASINHAHSVSEILLL